MLTLHAHMHAHARLGLTAASGGPSTPSSIELDLLRLLLLLLNMGRASRRACTLDFGFVASCCFVMPRAIASALKAVTVATEARRLSFLMRSCFDFERSRKRSLGTASRSKLGTPSPLAATPSTSSPSSDSIKLSLFGDASADDSLAELCAETQGLESHTGAESALKRVSLSGVTPSTLLSDSNCSFFR